MQKLFLFLLVLFPQLGHANMAEDQARATLLRGREARIELLNAITSYRNALIQGNTDPQTLSNLRQNLETAREHLNTAKEDLQNGLQRIRSAPTFIVGEQLQNLANNASVNAEFTRRMTNAEVQGEALFAELQSIGPNTSEQERQDLAQRLGAYSAITVDIERDFFSTIHTNVPSLNFPDTPQNLQRIENELLSEFQSEVDEAEAQQEVAQAPAPQQRSSSPTTPSAPVPQRQTTSRPQGLPSAPQSPIAPRQGGLTIPRRNIPVTDSPDSPSISGGTLRRGIRFSVPNEIDNPPASTSRATSSPASGAATRSQGEQSASQRTGENPTVTQTSQTEGEVFNIEDANLAMAYRILVLQSGESSPASNGQANPNQEQIQRLRSHLEQRMTELNPDARAGLTRVMQGQASEAGIQRVNDYINTVESSVSNTSSVFSASNSILERASGISDSIRERLEDHENPREHMQALGELLGRQENLGSFLSEDETREISVYAMNIFPREEFYDMFEIEDCRENETDCATRQLRDVQSAIREDPSKVQTLFSRMDQAFEDLENHRIGRLMMANIYTLQGDDPSPIYSGVNTDQLSCDVGQVLIEESYSINYTDDLPTFALSEPECSSPDGPGQVRTPDLAGGCASTVGNPRRGSLCTSRTGQNIAREGLDTPAQSSVPVRQAGAE